MYSDQEFEEAKSVVRSFGQKVKHQADALKISAQNCRANMEGDTVADNAAAELEKAMNKIQSIVDNDLKRLLDAMDRHQEDIHRATSDN